MAIGEDPLTTVPERTTTDMVTNEPPPDAAADLQEIIHRAAREGIVAAAYEMVLDDVWSVVGSDYNSVRPAVRQALRKAAQDVFRPYSDQLYSIQLNQVSRQTGNGRRITTRQHPNKAVHQRAIPGRLALVKNAFAPLSET